MKMTNNKIKNTATKAAAPENVHELKIGRITYIIVSHFNENARDTAITKIERLIERDAKAS